MMQPIVACLDLEGVLVPEIWINVAKKTGIESLRLTTREVPDYDALMKERLAILDRHGLRLADIQAVIASMRPLDGAVDFLQWLRDRCQVIIVSDTFYEFARPLMQQLGSPTLFCNMLEIDQDGRVINYYMRLADQKRQSVRALKNLRFRIVAAGDAYNDTPMLSEADAGFFFRPPEAIAKQFPQFPVTHTYVELKEQFCQAGVLRM